jgi:hypothetical protein
MISGTRSSGDKNSSNKFHSVLPTFSQEGDDVALTSELSVVTIDDNNSQKRTISRESRHTTTRFVEIDRAEEMRPRSGTGTGAGNESESCRCEGKDPEEGNPPNGRSRQSSITAKSAWGDESERQDILKGEGEESSIGGSAGGATEEEDPLTLVLFGDSPDNTLRYVSRFPFQPDVFLYEFFTHWFFPLSIPIVLAVQGLTACQTKWFLPSCHDVTSFLRNLLWMTGLAWAPLIYAIVVQARWATLMVSVSYCFGFFRWLIIAGKYASYRPEHYQQAMTDPNGDRGTVRNLLIVLWYHITDATLEEQLKEVEELCDIDLESKTLTLLNGARVNAKRYIRQLLRQTYGQPPSVGWIFVARFPTLLICGFPVWCYLEYAWNHSYHFSGVHDVIITVLCIIQCWYYAPVVFYFMIIGYFHFSRQLDAQTALVNAVSRRQVYDAGKQIRDLCMIDLAKDDNLYVWNDVRTLIHFYGNTVANRISFNTMATVLVVAFFVVLLLQQALAGIRDWKLLTFIAVMFLVLVGIAMATFVTGAQLNALDDSVVTMLKGEALQLANQALAVADYVALQQTQSKLLGLAEYLRARRETNPVTVMYLPASASLVSALVGGVISGILIFLQIAINGVKV